MQSVCFTKEQDDQLARGWPHQVTFVDGHPHDKNPLRSATALIGTIDPKYDVTFPREVAHRFLRVAAITQFKRNNFTGTQPTKKTLAVLETPGPISRDEAKRALAEAVVSCDQHYPFKAQDLVYCTEALIGADDTLDALATGFEATKLELPATGGTPLHTYFKTYTAGTIGFLLLRATDGAKVKLLPRLEAQCARFSEAARSAEDWNWCAEHFDMSLHGAAAVRRVMTDRVNLDYVAYAHDDPEFVRASAAAEPKQAMSVRLVKIGGLPVMQGLLARKFPAPKLAGVLRDFGMIRAPEAVELALSLIGKPSVKDAPIRWLVEHAAFARPIVEQAAKRGSKSEAAKAALALLV